MTDTFSSDGVLILKLDSKDYLTTIMRYVELCNEYFKSNPDKPTDEEIQLGIGYNRDSTNKETVQLRLGNTKSINNKSGEFQEAFQNAFKIFDEVAKNSLKKIFSNDEKLLKSIEKSLDPPPEVILKDEKYVSSSVLTVCKYFEDGKKLQCPSHTDQGLLTFLIELDVVAFQIYKPRKESNWSFINQEGTENPNNILVFPGEQLNIISNRTIKPTIHRVIKTGRERTSIFFKLRARPEYLGPMTDADYKLIMSQSNIKMDACFKSLASQLPEELIFIITFYSNIQDVMNMRLVSKSWKNAIDSETLWKFLSMAHFHVIGKDVHSWKEIYVQKYNRKKELTIEKSHYDKYLESLGKLKKIEKFGFKNSNEKPEELPKSLPENLKLKQDNIKIVGNHWIF